MRSFFLALAAGLATLFLGAAAQSANPYSVAIKVNDRVVTNYEIDQRISMLSAFGSSGDLRTLAAEQLINERLRLQAAQNFGVSVSEEELKGGVEELAARGKMTGDELYQFLAQKEVDADTLNDFVRAGLVWRTVVQSRFAQKANVSDAEVDTNLNLSAGQVQESVLISEIQLQLDERGNEKTLALAKKLSDTIKSLGAFSAAAQRYSISPSRDRGGRLDWLPLSSLPPGLAGQILALKPGEVTVPVTLTKTVGIFQLRAVRKDNPRSAEPVSITYTQVAIPLARGNQIAEAKSLISDVDTCADLRAESERFGKDAYADHTSDVRELPADVAAALEILDQNEATYYSSGENAVEVVMVCDRLRELPEGARENIRNALLNRRIGAFGDGFLQELRGDAEIVYQ